MHPTVRLMSRGSIRVNGDTLAGVSSGVPSWNNCVEVEVNWNVIRTYGFIVPLNTYFESNLCVIPDPRTFCLKSAILHVPLNGGVNDEC